MKKLILLASLITAFASSLQAQFLNPTEVSLAPVQKPRTIPRNGVSLMPLAIFGSGLDMAYDYFGTGNWDVKIIGGYYIASKPYMYQNINTGGYNYSQTSNSDYYTGEISNMEGYKFEVQVKRYVGSNESESTDYTLGLFAQYRSITGDFTGSRRNSSSSSGSVQLQNYSVGASGFLIGPMMNIDYHISKYVYLQAAVGSGLMIPMGYSSQNEIFSIPHINPYNKSINLKLNFAIGFNLN